MTVSWKSLPTLLHICLFLCSTGAVPQQFPLQPANQTVLQGSDVQFNATVEGQWPYMTWRVGGLFALTVPVDSNVNSSSYSARSYKEGNFRIVEFTIQNVNRSNNGLVDCSVQGAHGSKTAELNVQASGTVNILGGNVTVVQDQQVEFQCVTTAWFPIPTVSWTQNSNAIDSSLYNTSSIADGVYFNSTSVLKFQAVKNTMVECWATVPALTNPHSSSVSLVVASGSVNILGGNVTVEQDQQVEFQCVTTDWFPIPTVSWTQNSNAIDSSLYNTSSIADGVYFNSTSVLKFQAVKNTMVECWATVPALTNPHSSSVSLVVVPKPPDWTVLIAVVVSFGSAALLALLILGIIFCYQRRKEKQSNYQDEMSRRVRTKSQISTVSEAGLRRGQANAGFEREGQTSVAPSELTDSGSYQANGSIAYQMPDILNGDQPGNGYNSAQHTLDGSGFRKHRHLTFV